MGAEGEARGAERTGHMALCFATDATVRIVTAATAEDADWEVGVPLRSHWNRELHGMEEKVSCFAWVWQRLGGIKKGAPIALTVSSALPSAPCPGCSASGCLACESRKGT